MSRTPPFRSRPKLHLTLTPLAGSPIPSVQSTPSTTPFSTTTYSPFRTAGLKSPATHGGPVQFAPKRSSSSHGSYALYRVKRLLSSRAILLIVVFFGLIWWWSNGGREDLEVVKQKSNGFKKELFAPEITKDLQFYPASNAKIHVRLAR